MPLQITRARNVHCGNATFSPADESGRSVTGTVIPRLGNPAVRMLDTAVSANWCSRPQTDVPCRIGYGRNRPKGADVPCRSRYSTNRPVDPRPTHSEHCNTDSGRRIDLFKTTRQHFRQWSAIRWRMHTHRYNPMRGPGCLPPSSPRSTTHRWSLSR